MTLDEARKVELIALGKMYHELESRVCDKDWYQLVTCFTEDPKIYKHVLFAMNHLKDAHKRFGLLLDVDPRNGKPYYHKRGSR